MARATEFGKSLEAARRRQGFDTPYAFYRDRGGRKGLRLSFANYLRLERGVGLPQAWRLELILSALGLQADSPPARELVRSWVRDSLGSEKLMAALDVSAAPDPAPPSWHLAESAARQAISQRAVQLSLQQYKLLVRDQAAYACHAVLANTMGGLELGALAKTTGLPQKTVTRAVKALGSAGLAECSGKGAKSPLAGKYVTPPAPTPALAGVYAGLRKHRAAWIRERGRLLHSPYLVLRARRGPFSRYLAHLSDTVSLSAVYGDVQPAEDSEIYLVEGNVYRLF